jgi:hypothetical protein
MNKLALNLFLIINALAWTTVFSQSNESFLKEVEKDKKNRIDSLLNFNSEKQKLEYLALLPNLNYNFFEKSFNVGISISNLAGFYQTKHRNKIEIERLKFQMDQKLESDLQYIEKEYELILDTYEVLSLELGNTTLTTEIFNLKKAQYENNKITLEDWLNVQKNSQDRDLVILAKRKNLISKMKQFETKVKKPCFKKELDHLVIKSTNQ